MNMNDPLHDHIDSDILRYIVSRGLQPGDRVPPLSELSNELNISVSKLREQLEAARVLGVVEVRPRTGIRCLSFDFMPVLRLGLFFSMAMNQSNFDLYSNLRVHVEVAYWHEATALLQPADFDTLRDLVAEAQAKLGGQRITIPHAEHRCFHMGIFARLDNPFVRGVLEAYWEAYEAIELNRYAELAYLEQVWDYHQRIVEAIVAGDIVHSLKIFIEHTQLLRYQAHSEVLPSEYYGMMKLSHTTPEQQEEQHL